MELIYTMLGGLASSLTLPQFLLILFIIALSSVLTIVFVLKNSKATGFLSFLNTNIQEIIQIKLQIEQLSKKMDDIVGDVKISIADAFNKVHERDTEILEAINKMADMKDDINTLYNKLLVSINDLRNLSKLQDSRNTQTVDSLKVVLQHSLDLIRDTHGQIEKLDYYIRDQLPQFRVDHKDFSRGLSELSKDLALIERSIQTQMMAAGGITLR